MLYVSISVDYTVCVFHAYLLHTHTRMAQSFYMQVSVWMVRMDSELSYASSKSDPNGIKAEISSRASLFIQVLSMH